MEKKYNIPYGQQFLDKVDKLEVAKSLDQKFITTGKYVEKFEKALKKHLVQNLHILARAAPQVYI